jgi:hypothetical protein
VGVPRSKPELLLAGFFLLVHVVVSLTMKESPALSTFADLVASALLTGVAALVIWNAVRSKGRQEIFWAVFSGGVVLWAVSQFLWTYFEVILRQDVPDPFWGDVVVFIHVVRHLLQDLICTERSVVVTLRPLTSGYYWCGGFTST